ncbi:MAG: DUF3108 domain-containing protein [Azoarcus sp.]|jgi:hypothetical protein|nr:DUF3108 domain-containing protein [Azoarcus sp.]
MTAKTWKLWMTWRAAIYAVVVLAWPGWTVAAAAQGGTLRDWPAVGVIEFQVAYSAGGMQVGQARHRWSHEGGHYRMTLTVETTGLAALIRELGYTQEAVGEITPAGLRSTRFGVTQKGKEPEMAIFDWDEARVSIHRGERERRSAPLAEGDIDMLSLWHQLGHGAALPQSLLVVGNKEARRARVELLEEDSMVVVPAGRFASRHFRIEAEDGKLDIELWLARSRHWAPVKVMIDDAKSGRIVLEASSLRVPSRRTD